MIKVFIQPTKDQFTALCLRPGIDPGNLNQTVQTIFDNVKNKGDLAVLEYTSKLDRVNLFTSIIDTKHIDLDGIAISNDLKMAIHFALSNIEKFHECVQ